MGLGMIAIDVDTSKKADGTTKVGPQTIADLEAQTPKLPRQTASAPALAVLPPVSTGRAIRNSVGKLGPDR